MDVMSTRARPQAVGRLGCLETLEGLGSFDEASVDRTVVDGPRLFFCANRFLLLKHRFWVSAFVFTFQKSDWRFEKS
jgi:hypothetical protein